MESNAKKRKGYNKSFNSRKRQTTKMYFSDDQRQELQVATHCMENDNRC